MAFDERLTFDITNQRFVLSVSQPVFITAPEWYVGDVRSIQIQFVRRTSGQAVEVVSGSGITLQVALGSPGVTPTVYTSATAGVADSSHTFTVSLPLNVAGVVTAIGSSASISAQLEFKSTDGASPMRYRTTVTIKQNVISATLTDPTPSPVAISSAEAYSAFVLRDGSNTSYPCAFFIMVDEDDSSLKYKVSIRAGQFHAEPLT